MNRVRRTLALVRAARPAVQSIVFSMRMKAAEAREVVARRHRTQAADLIHAALRVSHCSIYEQPPTCFNHTREWRLSFPVEETVFAVLRVETQTLTQTRRSIAIKFEFEIGNGDMIAPMVSK